MSEQRIIGAAISGYVSALLWVNTCKADQDGEMQPIDLHKRESLGCFDRKDQERITDFVREFIAENQDDFDEYIEQSSALSHSRAEQFGHDLLLTRSGHGAGFWDRGLGDLGDRLSAAARVYGDTSAEYSPVFGLELTEW